MSKKFLLAVMLVVLLAMPAFAAEKEAKNALLLSPLEAYDLLMREPDSTFLLDVRSREEYSHLGHPQNAYNIPWRFSSQDLQISSIQGGPPVAVYQLSSQPNPDFVGVVRSLFKESDNLIIICDDGLQSAQASDALWQAGFKNVAQVKGGIWGEKLTSRETPRLAERYSSNYGKGGMLGGWVFWGLPISYQLDPRFLYPPDVKRVGE